MRFSGLKSRSEDALGCLFILLYILFAVAGSVGSVALTVWIGVTVLRWMGVM